MIGSRHAAGFAAAALVVTVSAAGCAGGRGAAAPAPPAVTSTSVTAAPATPAQADSEQAVRAVFAAYKQALLNRDAPAATARVSDSTIEYYGSLARLAGTGGPEEIGARSLVDRLTIALLRTQRSPADFAAVDGRQLFAYAVDAGLVDSSTVADVELGDVRVAGERAFAQAVIRGRSTPFDYEFVRADGRWLFDAVPALQAGNSALQVVAQKSGVPEDEFIFRAVESATGQRVDESIFAKP
ncbi:MAG TPA: hypothetical protein VD903_16895 [Pseudonocardia sp.]|nr:hypothetical protein [Pseudonocardia sp.]